MEHPSADKAAANAAAQPAQSTDTKLKPVSYVSLFRYATWVDVAMLVAACLCAMANGIVFPLFSLIMSGLLDSFFANDIMSTVGAYALYMLYIAIASLVLSLVQIGVAMIQAERQGIRIRDAYLRAILRQEAGYHDTHDMGEVSTRISGDVLNIVAGMGEKLTNGIQHGTSFVAGLIMAFIRGWDLTLVVLSLVPILVLGAGSMQYVLGKLQKGEQDGYAAAGAAASEAIAGIRTVAAYGGEEAEAARYARHLKKSETAGIKKAAAIGGSLGTLQFGILVSCECQRARNPTLCLSAFSPYRQDTVARRVSTIIASLASYHLLQTAWASTTARSASSSLAKRTRCAASTRWRQAATPVAPS